MVNRNLVILGIAESVSNAGSWVTTMAVTTLVVFRGGGGILESSGIWLAGVLPTILFSPLAGKICDKFDRGRVMLFSQLLSGAAVILLMTVSRFELILVCLACQTAFSSAMAPARQALVPDLVDNKEDISRANAFLQQLASLTKIGGPLIGAGLVSLIGAREAIAFDVVSYASAAVLLNALPRRRPIITGGKVSGAAVLRIFWSDNPALAVLFLGSFIGITAVTGLDTLLPVYVRDGLKAGEGLMGLLISGIGIGSVAAGVYVHRRKGGVNPWRDLKRGFAFLAVIPLFWAAGESTASTGVAYLAAVAGSLIGGWGNGLVGIQSATLLQLLVPQDHLGQVAGVYQSIVAMGQLVAILGLPLVVPGLLTERGFLIVSAATMLLVAVMLKAGLRCEGGAV